MNVKHIACLSGLVLLLSGCMGASTNPREGGLFGYSPEAYEQRQKEREVNLTAMEAEQRRESGQTSELEARRTSRARTVSQQQKDLQPIEKGLAAATQKLNAIKAVSAEQEARLAELRSRAAGLKNAMIEASAEPDTAARAAKLQQITKEAARLESYINNMSSGVGL